MTRDSILLDSNIVIDHFKGQSLYSAKLIAAEYYVPPVVVGELYAGAFRSARPDHHRRKIDLFLQHGYVLEVDADTSREYGRIWAQLAQE